MSNEFNNYFIGNYRHEPTIIKDEDGKEYINLIKQQYLKDLIIQIQENL